LLPRTVSAIDVGVRRRPAANTMTRYKSRLTAQTK
jgi:hypothetical protein